MGVWDTFIGLAATALKERPRKDVLAGLLELRDAMVACQKTYQDYQKILKEGDYDSVMEKRSNLNPPAGTVALLYCPRESWGETVANLAAVLTEVEGILTIFSPETAKHVRYYHIAEAMDPNEDDRPGRTRDPMDTLRAVDAGIDLQKVSISSQFELALGKLDEFTRQNFKPEEVFAAQKHIKPWPHPFRLCGDYWLALD
jgi:hypothetical protein